MDGIPIDVAEPAKARKYARCYLLLLAASLGVLGLALARDHAFPIVGAVLVAWVPLLSFYFRWRKIARCLEDKKKAETIACALGQKGADFVRVCATLKERLNTMQESTAVMADPSTWGRKQKLVTLRCDELEVVVYEKNGLVGDLKIYLR